jgi:carbon storage regulator
MLILSRKRNESILIKCGNDEIRIFLVAMRGNKCRIGLEAPRHIEIKRDDVLLVRPENNTDAPATLTEEAVQSE